MQAVKTPHDKLKHMFVRRIYSSGQQAMNTTTEGRRRRCTEYSKKIKRKPDEFPSIGHVIHPEKQKVQTWRTITVMSMSRCFNVQMYHYTTLHKIQG